MTEFFRNTTHECPNSNHSFAILLHKFGYLGTVFLRKCMQTLTLLTLSSDTKKGCCDIDCYACDMLCGQWESLVVIIDSSNTYPAQFRVPTQWGLIIQAQIISLNYYDGNN